MALMMSIVALSIDAVLPALAQIGFELGVMDENDNQLVVGALFLGMGFGQLLFGPMSDSTGRRKAMMLGYSVFVFASLLAVVANDFETLLFSRFLQGFGAAAPRVLTTAIVRDLYAGRAMARVMSFVMMIFILVPMLAPAFGQAILLFTGWRGIFIAILAIALISVVWYATRQAETLKPHDRRDFTVAQTRTALKDIFGNRTVMGYTLAAGIVSGPFVFYLSSSQQLFQQTYELGKWFPAYFATLAFAFGLASLTNGKYVMKHGMRKIVRFALLTMALSSIPFLGIAGMQQGLPPLWVVTVYLLISFFSVGLLFGNLTALAMEPLGHMAGIGSAVVGSMATFLSALLAILIGQQFDHTVIPLTLGFAAASLLTLALMGWIERRSIEALSE